MADARRGLARVGTFAVAAGLAVPVALLVPACLVDRGPGGRVRASLFPLALSAWDPFVWACARNSLIVAALVTLGSLGLGLALAGASGVRRFWGRGPLSALAWVPLAVVPAGAAVGLARLVPPVEVGRWLAEVSGRALPFGVGWDAWVGWGLLVWVGVAAGAPIVALGAGAALRRVDPAWVDAGVVLGATRGRARRVLAWPVARPEVARGLAAVFALALLEPGAPLVLGLRRTLAFQVVESIDRGDPAPRSAALAVLGLALAMLGRLAIRWWGGPRVAVGPRDRAGLEPNASPGRASGSAAILLVWSAFALAPLAGLVGIVAGGFAPGDRGWVVAVASTAYGLLDPDTGRLWGNALALGLLATAVAALGVPPSVPGRSPRPSLVVLALDRAPPLVLGVAAALVPGLLRMVADRMGWGWPGWVSAGLDPARWPALPLILAMAAARLPTLARAADRSALRREPALVDAARGLGASPRRADRMGGGLGPGPGAYLLTFALATTSVAPALVLSPSLLTRPVGPGIVSSADDPPRSAGLALGCVALNLAGLAAARKGRAGPAGDWFRG